MTFSPYSDDHSIRADVSCGMADLKLILFSDVDEQAAENETRAFRKLPANNIWIKDGVQQGIYTP